MAKYKTAMGKIVDMAQIAAKNEHVRAVGNMHVNARGDDIDSNGKVINPVTRKVGSTYQKTVSNRAANIVKKSKPAVPVPKNPVVNEADLTEEEREFMDTTGEDQEIEKIKAKEIKKK